MKLVVSSAAILVAACATPHNSTASLLDLYAASSIAGFHSHRVGFEGRHIDEAEARFDHRRQRSAALLAERFGKEAVTAIDRNIHEEWETVDFWGKISEKEEWARLVRARRTLSALERRIATEGS